MVAKHVNRENGGRTTHLSVSVLFLSLAALAATFQCCVFFIDAKPPPTAVNCPGNVAVRPRLGGLPHLATFTCQNATPAERVTLPGRSGNRLGGLSHLSCKRDQIKMRDYMERRVTPPRRVTSSTWGPPPPCKQALNGLKLRNFTENISA